MPREMTRRYVLSAGLSGLGMLLTGTAFGAAARSVAEAAEALVTPNEDLMREHGALRRLLLIYAEVRRRAAAGEPPFAALGEAADLIHRFVEDYHEKLEETYIFPAFEKAGRLTELTAVLRTQHAAGREITTRLQEIARGVSRDSGREVTTLIGQFNRMYHPHAAREDTVLFPQFPVVTGVKRYRELGEVFEDREQELFGKNGFEKIVAQVAGIEKQLGIYNLAKFTPGARRRRGEEARRRRGETADPVGSPRG